MPSHEDTIRHFRDLRHRDLQAEIARARLIRQATSASPATFRLAAGAAHCRALASLTTIGLTARRSRRLANA